MSSSPFDAVALADATRQFARQLAAQPGGCDAERIEVTLCGRGPIDRLFALEAGLLAAWPKDVRRPPHDLVADTGELRPAAELTLRALGVGGAELLRRDFAVEAKPKAAAHG
jgi:hypothetical protein